LRESGFYTAQGNPLDWQYFAKVVGKLNRAKAPAVDTQEASRRIAITRGRYRLMAEALRCLIDWKEECTERYHLYPPNTHHIITADDTPSG
jgi:hypothetical protein